MCSSLKILHFVGTEWKDITVPSNTFQNVDTVIFHSLSYIFVKRVDSNDLTSLETVTLQKGAFMHLSSFKMEPLASLTSFLMEGENFVDLFFFSFNMITQRIPSKLSQSEHPLSPKRPLRSMLLSWKRLSLERMHLNHVLFSL